MGALRGEVYTRPCDEQFANCRRELFTKLACFPFLRIAGETWRRGSSPLTYAALQRPNPLRLYRLSQNVRLERNDALAEREFPSIVRNELHGRTLFRNCADQSYG